MPLEGLFFIFVHPGIEISRFSLEKFKCNFTQSLKTKFLCHDFPQLIPNQISQQFSNHAAYKMGI